MLNITPIPDTADDARSEIDPNGYHAALRTADRIREFWARAGYDCEPRVYRQYVSKGDIIWCVRTDLENGLPKPTRHRKAAPAFRRPSRDGQHA